MDSTTAALFDLSGKVALVTGAARGIGQGIAMVLAGAGAAVAVADIEYDQAQATCRAMAAQGHRATALMADVSREESAANAVAATVEQLGRLDILVNNAGIFPMRKLRELDLATWEHTLAVNLGGAYLCTKLAAERMIAQGQGGRIVNISTINTARTYVGMAHYDSSKAGLNALTKAAALEYAPFAITVNAVAPGAVKTPGSLTVRRELGGGNVEAADAEFAKRIPLGRWADPVDIGHAVLCFVGRAAAYITGQVIYADGGLMLGF